MDRFIFEVVGSIPQNPVLRNNLPVPDLIELSRLCEIYETQKHIMILKEYDEIVCILPLMSKREKLYGLCMNLLVPVGYGFYDYSTFYYKDIKYLDMFLEHIRSYVKRVKADAVLIPNLILADPVPGSIYHYSKEDNLLIFNPVLSETGWDEVLSKKDIKRYWKNSIKKDAYRVLICEGDSIEDNLEFIAQKHIERWQFENINSPFLQKDRKRVFGCNLYNKVFIKLEFKEDWLAFIYGMKLNNTFLFHTPVINVNHLKSCPLKVLIAETYKYCRDNDVKIMDLGLGHEEYKKRYTNDERNVYSFFCPNSLKARIFNLVYPKRDPQPIVDALLRIKYFKL